MNAVFHKKSHLVLLSVAVNGFAILAIFPASALGNPETSKLLLDCLHFPAFWCLEMLLLSLMALTIYAHWYQVGAITLVVTASAVLLEIAQPYFGRTQDFADLGLGILGAFTAAVHYSYIRGFIGMKSGRLLMATLYLLFSSIIIFKIIMLYNKNNAITKGFTFESHFSSKLWQNSNGIESPALRRHKESLNNHVLRGQLLTYDWSGASFENQLGFDISSYTFVSLRFYNPSHDVKLNFRIDDKNGQAVYPNAQIMKQGWNVVSFPLDKTTSVLFNNRETTKIAFFFKSKNGPDYYYLDDIYFVKQDDL